MSKFVISKVLVFCSICLFFLTSCSTDLPNEYLIRGETMGTTYNVKLVSDNVRSPDEINDYQVVIERALSRIDALMSTYRNDSEVSILNNMPKGQSMSVSPQTYEVLSLARDISRFTDGFFDITVGPLVDLWGFGPNYKHDQVPSNTDIVIAKEKVDWRAIELTEGKVYKNQDVSVDLSAIAKGYAVDQVALALKKLSLKNFLVEVGGEVTAFGLNKRNQPWVLGIEQPSITGRKLYAAVSLGNKSLATSGDYRNYFEKDGQRYSHTIDSKSGYPINHRLASVSVIADSCAESDSLATALMVMGEKKGYQFALSEGINAYFIYRENESFNTIHTPGFEPYLN